MSLGRLEVLLVDRARDGAHDALLLLHERLAHHRSLRRLLGLLDLDFLLFLPLFLSLPAKLDDKFRERPLRVGNELGVSALLRDAALVDANDEIASGEEVEGVGDEDSGTILEGTADRVVEEVLADVRVDGGEGVVKEDRVGSVVECACDVDSFCTSLVSITRGRRNARF